MANRNTVRQQPRRLLAVVLCLIGFVAGSLAGFADTTNNTRASTLFATGLPGSELQPLKVTLNAVIPKNRKARSETPATLILESGISIPLKLSARGKSRRRECVFPPLRLNFAKATTAGTPFEGQNKLKLVTHCSKAMSRGDFLAAEMLAYRLLNRFTDRSFRVRALHITYSDTATRRTEQHHAFLIEHKKSVAKRTDMTVVSQPSLTTRELDGDHAALIAVFQYLLGNTDYSMRRGPPKADCCHNLVPFTGPGSSSVVGIPYDFDATGLVNPPYAQPQPDMNLISVKQRKYRGYCAHNNQLDAAVERFINQKAELYELFATFNAIPGLNRRRTKKYLDSFYKVLENPKKRGKKFERNCR